MSAGTTILRPKPLDEATTRIEEIRNYLGFRVYPDSVYAASGLLAPGLYARDETVKFLTAIQMLGSNKAIDKWIAANPLKKEVTQ